MLYSDDIIERTEERFLCRENFNLEVFKFIEITVPGETFYEYARENNERKALY